MAKYRLTDNSASDTQNIVREDGAHIPPDSNNRDYAEYLIWKAAGNTPDPAPTIAVIIPGISKRQLLTWLLSVGKTEADVLAALNSISDPTVKAHALIDWNYPDGLFQRTNPLFDQLGIQFSMSPSDIDAGFIAAAIL